MLNQEINLSANTFLYVNPNKESGVTLTYKDGSIKKPKKSCRKCFGRGYIGLNPITKSTISCSCYH